MASPYSNKCHIPIAQRVSLLALLFWLIARSLLRCPLIAPTSQPCQNLTISPSLFTILTSHSLCTNTGYLTNSHRLYKHEVPQHHSARTLMVLLLSGDVESNPGPHPSMYPCGICELGVTWSRLAVCCDNCDIWYHKSCISMNSQEYDRIETTDWNCFACNSKNCSSFLYHAYNLNVSNSFDPLAGIPGDDSVFLHSVCSPVSVFEPHAHSSPNSPQDP